MAQFVHLTDLNQLGSIRRSGLKAKRGLYAMPVVPDFYASHQWQRELRRRGSNHVCAVYFRVPDDTEVEVGHYAHFPLTLSASEAVALIMKAGSAEGFEVRLPHAVPKSAIYKIAKLRQVIGWRYSPTVRSNSPCACPMCIPYGTKNGRRKREASSED